MIYIKKDSNNEFENVNFYNAYAGFKQLGKEVKGYKSIHDIQNSRKEDIVVGYVDTVKSLLYSMEIETTDLDYPEELTHLLGRKVWDTKLSEVINDTNIFIKPIADKLFTGRVINGLEDLRGCGRYGEDTDIRCSEVVDFKSEWRCFVRYGCIQGIKHYKGDYRLHPDYTLIDDAVRRYKSAPAGCAIDFGVDGKGRTLLIEVNDGYSLGSYGLESVLYAKLISARWAELTNTIDDCNF